MRKKWLIFFGSVILIVSLTIVAFATSTVKLIINGREIKPDVPPQIINGRAMVPIKCVAEALGAKIQWDKQNKIVVISSSDKVETDLIGNYLRTA
ncbi:copper amine oxidase N-terminal domain-containing protein [Thermoanaerobacter mathranii]|uniref:copper amine oxidase N-terminal domain-containing protein n=1 Tax=Thermoanaerobacter mathranii TaxID=583357 RepID=UPI003D6A87F5